MEKDPSKQHPMVAVPDAIRIVLQQTAKVLLDSDGGKSTSMKTVSTKNTPWEEIFGKTLAEDVLMSEPGYPPYNASIMDGFTLRTDEYCNAGENKDSGSSEEAWTHNVIDKVYAGDDETSKKVEQESKETGLAPAYYITTGAVVPDTFDCVVPIEEVKFSSDKRKIIIEQSSVKRGKWIRDIGCDVEARSIVLPKGSVIDAVALGLIKQSGATEIKILEPIAVGVLSTGNELISVEDDIDKIRPGQIPDVNRPILLSLLSSMGICRPVDLGMERDDDVEGLEKAIQSALSDCDVIITTGGISMGETDIVEHVLVERLGGTLHFGRMHMKPGKPTTLVSIPSNKGTRLVFAMPGNPVSATVCTHLVASPCLNLLFNGADPNQSLDEIVQNATVQSEVQAILSHDVKLDPRPEYRRVTLSLNGQGLYEANSTGVQRSSRLMSMRDAQGFMVLPSMTSEKPVALKGEVYTVILCNSDRRSRVIVANSLHLNPKTKKKPLQIGVVQVTPSSGTTTATDITDRVQKALCGSKSGSVLTSPSQVYSGDPEDLWDFIASIKDDADILVVSCMSSKGTFPYYLDLTKSLREKLDKVAETLAQEARRGAASQNSEAALFSVVVGFIPSKRGTILICLPEIGLDDGLSSVRGLLKHALQTGRGQCSHSHSHHHKHHHKHKHHKHKHHHHKS